MEGTTHLSEQRMAGVEPVALSRQATVIMVAVAILLWSSAFLLWGQVELDKWMVIGHNGLRANDLLFSVARAVSRYGMPVIVLIYLIYLLVAFKYEALRDAYRIYLMVFLMFAFAGIGGDLLKEIFDRPRPIKEYAGEIIAHSSVNTPAFPSGHATKSTALALPFLILIAAKDKRHKGLKALIALVALSVCYSRVFLGAHFVSDVLAGIGMALLCFPLVNLISNKMLSRMSEARFQFAIKVWALILLGLLIYLVVS